MIPVISAHKVPHEDKSFIEKVFTRIIEQEHNSVKDLLKVVGYNITLIYVNSNKFNRSMNNEIHVRRKIDFSNMTLELDENRNNTIISVMVG